MPLAKSPTVSHLGSSYFGAQKSHSKNNYDEGRKTNSNNNTYGGALNVPYSATVLGALRGLNAFIIPYETGLPVCILQAEKVRFREVGNVPRVTQQAVEPTLESRYAYLCFQASDWFYRHQPSISP